MEAPIDKSALSLKWLSDKMANHPNWRASLPPARSMIVHQGKCLVVWKMSASGPRIVDMLKVANVQASFTSGLVLTLTSGTFGENFIVTAHPREILTDVFMWIPPFADVRFTPMSFTNDDSVWRMTLPMLLRTSGGTEPQLGQVAVSTLKEFRAQWPEIAI